MIRLFSTVLLVSVLAATSYCQDRETKVRNDRKKVVGFGEWMYNDLPGGIEAARKSGKPLLVVFRCVPCEACAQLDEQVVERDPAVRSLMDKFELVRIVHANGMDMSLFQFDYDQSWAAFFLNADMTIYGRYGTRSHQTRSEDDVSLEGFGKALEAALVLHAEFPKNRELLAAKRGPASAVKVPEEFPSLRGKYKSTLDYEGKVVQSCIHCHQVGEALRLVYRNDRKPIPESVLFPYPNPKVLGIVLDPKDTARVTSVVRGSAAERAGINVDDRLATLERQPLVSIADVQWVLQNAGDSGTLNAQVIRDKRRLSVDIPLERGWRTKDNISWRATSWDLRRMVFGGMLLEELPAAERKRLALRDEELALRVKHVGEYGNHAVAKNAGIRKGDVVISMREHSEAMTESDLLSILARETRPGDRIKVAILRSGKRIETSLTMQ